MTKRRPHKVIANWDYPKFRSGRKKLAVQRKFIGIECYIKKMIRAGWKLEEDICEEAYYGGDCPYFYNKASGMDYYLSKRLEPEEKGWTKAATHKIIDLPDLFALLGEDRKGELFKFQMEFIKLQQNYN